MENNNKNNKDEQDQNNNDDLDRNNNDDLDQNDDDLDQNDDDLDISQYFADDYNLENNENNLKDGENSQQENNNDQNNNEYKNLTPIQTLSSVNHRQNYYYYKRLTSENNINASARLTNPYGNQPNNTDNGAYDDVDIEFKNQYMQYFNKMESNQQNNKNKITLDTDNLPVDIIFNTETYVLFLLFEVYKHNKITAYNFRLINKSCYNIVKKYKHIFIRNPTIFGLTLNNSPELVNLINLDFINFIKNYNNKIFYHGPYLSSDKYLCNIETYLTNIYEYEPPNYQKDFNFDKLAYPEAVKLPKLIQFTFTNSYNIKNILKKYITINDNVAIEQIAVFILEILLSYIKNCKLNFKRRILTDYLNIQPRYDFSNPVKINNGFTPYGVDYCFELNSKGKIKLNEIYINALYNEKYNLQLLNYLNKKHKPTSRNNTVRYETFKRVVNNILPQYNIFRVDIEDEEEEHWQKADESKESKESQEDEEEDEKYKEFSEFINNKHKFNLLKEYLLNQVPFDPYIHIIKLFVSFVYLIQDNFYPFDKATLNHINTNGNIKDDKFKNFVISAEELIVENFKDAFKSDLHNDYTRDVSGVIGSNPYGKNNNTLDLVSAETLFKYKNFEMLNENFYDDIDEKIANVENVFTEKLNNMFNNLMQKLETKLQNTKNNNK